MVDDATQSVLVLYSHNLVQGRSQGGPGGPGVLIEMLFEAFRLNFN